MENLKWPLLKAENRKREEEAGAARWDRVLRQRVDALDGAAPDQDDASDEDDMDID